MGNLTFPTALRAVGWLHVIAALILCIMTWPDAAYRYARPGILSYSDADALRRTLIISALAYAVAGTVTSLLWFALARIIDQLHALRHMLEARARPSPVPVDQPSLTQDEYIDRIARR
jgi:hypothetical protein